MVTDPQTNTQIDRGDYYTLRRSLARIIEIRLPVLLHCALSLAVQCIVIGPVRGGRAGGVCLCVFICGSVTTITRNCVHRSSLQTGSVGAGSDRLQLIKFWPSCAPGTGVCGGTKIFVYVLLQPARSVCVSLGAFSSSSLLL